MLKMSGANFIFCSATNCGVTFPGQFAVQAPASLFSCLRFCQQPGQSWLMISTVALLDCPEILFAFSEKGFSRQSFFLSFLGCGLRM